MPVKTLESQLFQGSHLFRKKAPEGKLGARFLKSFSKDDFLMQMHILNHIRGYTFFRGKSEARSLTNTFLGHQPCPMGQVRGKVFEKKLCHKSCKGQAIFWGQSLFLRARPSTGATRATGPPQELEKSAR